MNKRILAISDIHGCVDLLNQLLEKVNYNSKEDQLILLGDYVDRGLKSKQTIDRIIELQKEGAIALIGNHDDMMYNSLKLKNDEDQMASIWLNNGAFQTIESYVGFDFFEQGFDWDVYKEAKDFIKENYAHHIEFLGNLLPYYETEDYIFVHAGFLPPLTKHPLESQTLNELIWIREEFQQFPTGVEKMVVFGHTPTQMLHRNSGRSRNRYSNDPLNNDIWIDPVHLDKTCIDGGACFNGGQLNCLIIEGKNISSTWVKKRVIAND